MAAAQSRRALKCCCRFVIHGDRCDQRLKLASLGFLLSTTRRTQALAVRRVRHFEQVADKPAPMAVRRRPASKLTQRRLQNVAIDQGGPEHAVGLAKPPIGVLVTEPVGGTQISPQTWVIDLLVRHGLDQPADGANCQVAYRTAGCPKRLANFKSRAVARSGRAHHTDTTRA